MSPSAPAAASMLVLLPDEVLKLVLSHVPLKHRLSSCCLAHSRLHAAAMAATQQLEIGSWPRPPPPQRTQAMVGWLSVYGQHVTHLRVWDLDETLPALQLQSCPNLLELRLEHGGVRLAPTADGRRGVVDANPKLTRLELIHARVLDRPAVDSLSRLVHLRHLDTGSDVVSLSDATLPRLRHLTHLGARLPLSNILQLGALTSLQELSLTYHPKSTVSSGSLAGLVLPFSLTKLELSQRVALALLPLAPAGLRALSLNWFAAEGWESLLSCMARLQCLTQLVLSGRRVKGWPPPGPAYSALTASSSLVSLQVFADFPAGVWPFVFRATHQLPHLTSLGFADDLHHIHAPSAFRPSDLAGLVSCCPNLCDIDSMLLSCGPHELCKLTGLTHLVVYCGVADRDAVAGLAAITQLKRLSVGVGAPVGRPLLASLLALTSLTALTSITATNLPTGHWMNRTPVLSTGIRQADSPPVWLWLLECCAAADPSCQPRALCSLAQQLAEQRTLIAAHAQQTAALQAQLSNQQQRNELLQQQHVAAQQVAAQQTAKIEAQQQVAEAQEARVAALERQLQQLLQRPQ